MRKSTILILASTALIAQPVLAQDAAVPADAEAEDADVIVVFGKGETRQVQELSNADIVILTPGTSPLKAIERLPSVNFQSADPFGNYEWSTRVTIRSFSQNQLGFNFDGIPLGDMTYGNHNGLHISRVVSPENIGSVRVSQGAGGISTQSTNNLGGTVESFSIDPAGRMNVTAAGTYGSHDTMRGFVRMGAGAEDGLRGFVSYAYGTTDKYKGIGIQDQQMINAKFVAPIGEVELDGWFSWSDRREQDYQDMSLDMLARLGYKADNLFPDYASAVLIADIGHNRGETGQPVTNAAAGTKHPGSITSVDDAYYDASGLRRDVVAAIGMKTPLGENATFRLRGYFHDNKGRGLWGTPYLISPTGAPLSVRTTEYEMERVGLYGAIEATIAEHSLTIGGWYEKNKFNQARRFYAFASRTDPGLSFRKYPENPFFTQWEFDFNTETLQYFVSDKIDLGALKINVGSKGFRVSNEAIAIIRASFPEGNIKVEDWFQPHIGAAYEIGDSTEVFAGFTQATRSFASATTTGPFSTNQTGFDNIRSTLKPETSDTFELGLRYNSGVFNGVLGAYLVNFKNRLLSAAAGPSIVGSPSILQNVGSVRSVGFEAAGDVKLGGGLSVYASYSYTDATYRDDVRNVSGQLLAAIKGKTVIDSPKHLLRGELNYDSDGLFGRIGVNHMSKRYFTYTNDRSVPGRTLVDATIGYKIGELIELQVNATNLFDELYLSTINSGGTGNSGDRQTLLVGAPQQFFATVKVAF